MFIYHQSFKQATLLQPRDKIMVKQSGAAHIRHHVFYFSRCTEPCSIPAMSYGFRVKSLKS